MESRVCLKRSRAALSDKGAMSSDKVEEMNEDGLKINNFLDKIRENEERDYNDFVKVLNTKAADIKPKKKVQSSISNSSSRDKLYDFLDDVAYSIPDSADNNSISETSDGNSSDNSSDDSNTKEGVSNRSTNLLNNIDAIGSIIKSNSFWNDLFMMESESLATNQSDSASKSKKVNIIEY